MPRNRATSEEFVEVQEEPVKRTIAEELEQMKNSSWLLFFMTLVIYVPKKARRKWMGWALLIMKE